MPRKVRFVVEALEVQMSETPEPEALVKEVVPTIDSVPPMFVFDVTPRFEAVALVEVSVVRAVLPTTDNVPPRLAEPVRPRFVPVAFEKLKVVKAVLPTADNVPPTLRLVETPKAEAVAFDSVVLPVTFKVPPMVALLLTVSAVPAPLRTKVDIVALPEVVRVPEDMRPVVWIVPEPALSEPTVAAPETDKVEEVTLLVMVKPEKVGVEVENRSWMVFKTKVLCPSARRR